jgi:hypothetical protein
LADADDELLAFAARRTSARINLTTAARLTRRAGAGTQPTLLCVALYGRVLAFDWHFSGVLFRAERQSVARVGHSDPPRCQPDDPSGTIARVAPHQPIDLGTVRLELPTLDPSPEIVSDDAGFCLLTQLHHADAPRLKLVSRSGRLTTSSHT